MIFDDRKEIRKTNLELLRIISMLLVITLHCFMHGLKISTFKPMTLGYILGWIIEGIAFTSVNCYVLITSYFLVDKQFKAYRTVKTWMEIEFYSLLLFIISVITDIQNFSIKKLLVAIFPIVSREYWFATVYVGLLLISPLLNYCIVKMNKRQHRFAILVLSLLFSVIPNIFFIVSG